MEVTLEKIELVKDRTGVSYKDAKEALEAADGSVVDAIINIEENIDAMGGKSISEHGSAVADQVKELVNKGNVSRISVKKMDGEVLVNLPVTAGVVATLIAPGGILISMIAAFGFKCIVEVVKTDGTIIDVSSRANDAIDKAKEKSSDIFEKAKEKSQDVKEKVKDSDTLEKFKDKADDVKDKVMSSDAYEKVMDKAGDAFGTASEKVDNIKDKFTKDDNSAEEMAKDFEEEFEHLDDIDVEGDAVAGDVSEAADSVQEAVSNAAGNVEEAASEAADQADTNNGGF